MAKKKTTRSTQTASPARGRKTLPAARRAKPAQPADQHFQRLYLLSDSTGNLARHTLTAVLTQFPPDAFDVRPRTFLDTPSKLQARLQEIESHPGAVVHAMVSPEAKTIITERCHALNLPVYDLTGGIVHFLTRAGGTKPAADVRRLHDVNDEYRRRIKAIEFTLEHDDGLKRESLLEADLVLAGVSRTSKTPTSIYLAQQGFKIGNVALAYEVAPPAELLALPKNKVVGLVIDPRQLTEIRTRRQREWRVTATSYNDPTHVQREITWSRQLFQRQGWPIVDVTNQSVEETAAKVLALAGLQT